MKKFIITAVAVILALSVSGCGKKTQKPVVSPSPDVSASPTAKSDIETKKDENDKTGIKRISDETEIVAGEVDTDNDERDFTGIWRAVGTTSENAAFESMELEIHYSGYTVSMTFTNNEYNTVSEGTYKIKNGVLEFDDNFQDCTAYFYDDNEDTLILDNGTSLVYCEKQELEKDMR